MRTTTSSPLPKYVNLAAVVGRPQQTLDNTYRHQTHNTLYKADNVRITQEQYATLQAHAHSTILQQTVTTAAGNTIHHTVITL